MATVGSQPWFLLAVGPSIAGLSGLVEGVAWVVLPPREGGDSGREKK